MIIAFDIDGVISAAPEQMQTIASGLRAEGHYVALISAISKDQSASGNTWQSKCDFLTSVGFTAWDELVTVDGDVPALKSQWLKDHAVQIYADNSIPNCKAAVKAGIPLVLLPWETRTKKSLADTDKPRIQITLEPM